MNEDTILIGRGTNLFRIPQSSWEEALIRASSTGTETKTFSSGQKNTHENTGSRPGLSTGPTSPWIRPPTPRASSKAHSSASRPRGRWGGWGPPGLERTAVLGGGM